MRGTTGPWHAVDHRRGYRRPDLPEEWRTHSGGSSALSQPPRELLREPTPRGPARRVSGVRRHLRILRPCGRASGVRGTHDLGCPRDPAEGVRRRTLSSRASPTKSTPGVGEIHHSWIGPRETHWILWHPRMPLIRFLQPTSVGEKSHASNCQPRPRRWRSPFRLNFDRHSSPGCHSIGIGQRLSEHGHALCDQPKFGFHGPRRCDSTDEQPRRPTAFCECNRYNDRRQ
jgi:hypothetical protein